MAKKTNMAKPEEEEVDETPEEEKKSTKSSKTEASVYAPDGSFIRTYTKELHGDKVEALAKEFASKVPGRTVR